MIKSFQLLLEGKSQYNCQALVLLNVSKQRSQDKHPQIKHTAICDTAVFVLDRLFFPSSIEPSEWLARSEYNNTIIHSGVRKLKQNRNYKVHRHQTKTFVRTVGVMAPNTPAVSSLRLRASDACCSYLNRRIIPWTIAACNRGSGPLKVSSRTWLLLPPLSLPITRAAHPKCCFAICQANI